MQKIICMKWGSRYGPEFVNRLYASIKRPTRKTTKIYCFTDNLNNINENVICKPLPKINLPSVISSTPWRKLSIWQFPLYDLTGDVLFLDLDLVITGNLDRFFDYKPGHYCVIENWTQLGKNIGKSLYEKDFIELAKTIVKNKKILLPSHVVVTKGRDSDLEEKHVDLVDDDDIIFDVGQTSIEDFSKYINSAKTIFWN